MIPVSFDPAAVLRDLAMAVSTTGSLLSSLVFKLKNAPGDAVSCPSQADLVKMKLYAQSVVSPPSFLLSLLPPSPPPPLLFRKGFYWGRCRGSRWLGLPTPSRRALWSSSGLVRASFRISGGCLAYCGTDTVLDRGQAFSCWGQAFFSYWGRGGGLVWRSQTRARGARVWYEAYITFCTAGMFAVT